MFLKLFKGRTQYCSTRAICSSSFSISVFIRGEAFIDKVGSPWAVRLRLEGEEEEEEEELLLI